MIRAPHVALRPFVHTLWVSDHARRALPFFREQALPDGRMHLVIRLSNSPIHIVDAAHPEGYNYGFGVIGGARASSYTREVSGPARAIGAMLLPGAAQALFKVSALELADRHTRLSDVWGAPAQVLRERMIELDDPAQQLELFELHLLACVPQVKGIHPSIAQALQTMNAFEDVRTMVAKSGVSHRRFIDLFGRTVGLTPKRFARVQRFRKLLATQAKYPARSWTELAMEAGYTDQPHFNREFRELAGMTPQEYRHLMPESPGHVLLDPSSQTRKRT